MAKKSNLTKYISPLALLLAVGAICMLFLTAVKYSIGDNVISEYTGLQVVFGYETTGLIKVQVFSFSFMNLLPYVLLLAGAVLILLNIFGKKSKLFTLISAICFVVAGVFFFLVVSNIVIANEYDVITKNNLVIGIGSILGGILSILAGACQTVNLLIK